MRSAPPAIVTRSLQHAGFAATDLRVDKPEAERSAPAKWEDAYTICVMQKDMPGKRYWEEGVEVGVRNAFDKLYAYEEGFFEPGRTWLGQLDYRFD